MMTMKGNFRTFSVVGLGSMLGLAAALGGSLLPTNRDELSHFVYTLDSDLGSCSSVTGTGQASPCCYQRAEEARIKAALEGKVGPASCDELAQFESCSAGSTDLVLLGDDLSEANVKNFTMGLMGLPCEPLASNR